MKKEDISKLKQIITERGLQRQLKRSLRILRPTISADTIARAWQVEEYESAPDALKLVLRTADKVKREDDARIERELQQDVEKDEPALQAA